MADYILIDSNGLIVNRIVLDDIASWEVPEGHTLESADGYEVGGTIIDGVYSPPPAPPAPPSLPKTIMAQDLMAQFTSDDLTKIKAAVDSDIQFWGLWSSLLSQATPMQVTSERFLAGWAALVEILGQPRMDEIAAALDVQIAG